MALVSRSATSLNSMPFLLTIYICAVFFDSARFIGQGVPLSFIGHLLLTIHRWQIVQPETRCSTNTWSKTVFCRHNTFLFTRFLLDSISFETTSSPSIRRMCPFFWFNAPFSYHSYIITKTNHRSCDRGLSRDTIAIQLDSRNTSELKQTTFVDFKYLLLFLVISFVILTDSINPLLK